MPKAMQGILCLSQHRWEHKMQTLLCLLNPHKDPKNTGAGEKWKLIPGREGPWPALRALAAPCWLWPNNGHPGSLTRDPAQMDTRPE